MPLLRISAHDKTQSAECRVWFDRASKDRTRWDRVSKLVSKNKKFLPKRPQASVILNDKTKVKRSSFEDTSISAFKYVILDTSLQSVVAIGSDTDFVIVDLRRLRILYSKVRRAMLFTQSHPSLTTKTRELHRLIGALFTAFSNALAQRALESCQSTYFA